jgi:outer membrane murein-binding lipoprotein Lpp
LEDLRTSAAIDFGSTYSRSGRGNANANNDDKDEGGGFDDGDFEMAYTNPMVAAAESAAVLPKPAKVAVDTEYLSGRVEKLEYDNKQLEEEVQAAKKECKTYRAENIALRDLIEQLQPGEELYLAPVV